MTKTINPSDLYAQMLEVAQITPTVTKRGCIAVSKKEVKAAKMEWSFVENACQVLGLQLKRDGRWGFVIFKR